MLCPRCKERKASSLEAYPYGRVCEVCYREMIIHKEIAVASVSIKCPLSEYQTPCQYGHTSRNKCFFCKRISEL